MELGSKQVTRTARTLRLEPGDTGDDLRDEIYSNDLEEYKVYIEDGVLVFLTDDE